MTSPCVPDWIMAHARLTADTKPTRVPQGRRITVGTRELNSEHTLFVYRGLYFCRSCGYYASRHAQKLVGGCLGMNDSRARGRVMKLLAGKMPSGMKSWPNDPKRLAQLFGEGDSDTSDTEPDEEAA